MSKKQLKICYFISALLVIIMSRLTGCIDITPGLVVLNGIMTIDLICKDDKKDGGSSWQ